MFPKIALFCKSTWKLRFCTCFNYQITFRKDREWAYWGIFSLSGNWGIVWKIWEQLNLRRTVLIFGSILSKLCNGVRRRLWDWIKLRERESGYGVWIETSQRELEGDTSGDSSPLLPHGLSSCILLSFNHIGLLVCEAARILLSCNDALANSSAHNRLHLLRARPPACLSARAWPGALLATHLPCDCPCWQ